MMLNSKTIGNKIADARKKIHLSQSELAQKVSISPQAVGKWERGESMPDIITLNKLAEIFSVDLNYFSESSAGAESFNLQEQSSISSVNLNRESEKNQDWNWDMSQGNWADADFSGLKNLREKFSNSNIKNCRFMNSDLSGLILGSNNIDLCDFSSSDLRNSRIQGSNLQNTKFDHCSFIDAVFIKNNVGKCSFNEANFSGMDFTDGNFENNSVGNVTWKFTSFRNSGISNVVFEGEIEDCRFENCSFYNVTFQNAVIKNTFFKYNRRFKKVKFLDCRVDSITFAFLKNNQADLSAITLME